MFNPPRIMAGALSIIALGLLTAGAVISFNSARLNGDEIKFGAGTVSAYAELESSGEPNSIGVQFSLQGLESPPEGVSDLTHCFDRDGDGSIAKPEECAATHEFVVPMPEEIANRDDVPFKWVLLNWNPVGHMPPGVYDTPHFDIHFMIDSEENVFSIEDGPCGPEFVRCDQFEEAKMPVPSNYMNSDFKDVEAIVPAMGNHLVDVTASEFGGEAFTRTWIFGIYGGRVTFYEEMATLKHILDKPDTCNAIKSPPAVALSGFYPKSSCIRYDESRQRYTVSMEDFAYREAEEPAMDAESDGE